MKGEKNGKYLTTSFAATTVPAIVVDKPTHPPFPQPPTFMLEGKLGNVVRQPPRYPSNPSTVDSELMMDESEPSTPFSLKTHRRSPVLSLHSPALSSPRVVSPSSPSYFFGTEALGDASLDTFTRYFACDHIAHMNQADAVDLVNTLEHSQWSGKEYILRKLTRCD